MKIPRAFVTGMGVICPAGSSPEEVLANIQGGGHCLRPLDFFRTTSEITPLVGQVDRPQGLDDLPRSHALVMHAALEAMKNDPTPPDAIVVGVATGGVHSYEETVRVGAKMPEHFRFHAVDTVTQELAQRLNCRGPALTVSTACSSGALSLTVGLNLIRSGQAKRVLACGVDGLSRLTYYGFYFLQLIDPSGARPFDRTRNGMSLGEGAAALLLVAGNHPPEGALAELRGAGLSCDAYHPVAPHPEGLGALRAMDAALRDAGVTPRDIDYINLHGTGTTENDASEAAAVRTLFGSDLPTLSSTKGMMGHTTAGAGAIEALISILAIQNNLAPANVGLKEFDPALGLEPIRTPEQKKISLVLSNSFGFGGNNACLVLGRAGLDHAPQSPGRVLDLEILNSTCISGAGGAKATLDRFFRGESCAGQLPQIDVGAQLPPRTLRRLKRLPRLALSLAHEAVFEAPVKAQVNSVYWGTGFGASSEIASFLNQLFETKEQFSSPSDFIGSVHNAPAGQAAMYLQAHGPNVTASGANYSFEQVLYLAGLCEKDDTGPILLIAADEAHLELAPYLNPPAFRRTGMADGGGGFLLRPTANPTGRHFHPAFFQRGEGNPGVVPELVQALGGPDAPSRKYGAVLLGRTAGTWESSQKQWDAFLGLTGFAGPAIEYRELLGDFPTSPAIAAAAAVGLLDLGFVPEALAGKQHLLTGKGILMLSLGDVVTAIEILG
ncbi:MAG: beta-ketoacyl-[acyl-carrier-protein] synthase family protein [Pseudomonadota bacterium]